MKTYVLYHRDTDGFGGAWSAYASGLLPKDTNYISVNYNEPMPEIEDNSEVYIIDFSYPREELIKLNERSKKLVVLDHHKSAQKDLDGLDFCIFDMNKSGAVLAWEYFNPTKSIPHIILYVQDFDLWQFKLPDSKIITQAINSLPHDFYEWAYYYHGDQDTNMDALYDRGVIIREFVENQVFPNLKIKECKFENIDIASACSIYPLISDCNEYVHEITGKNVAMTYCITADLNVSCSIRAYDDTDVSLLAKKYGGGGHKSAAGFRVSLDTFKIMLY